MNNLDLLVVKKKSIEDILEILAQMVPATQHGRLTTFLPFAVKAIVPEKSSAQPAPIQPIELKEKETTEGDKVVEVKSPTASKGEGGTQENFSLRTVAQQKVNEDFICLEWLQEFGQPVSKKTVEEFAEELGTSIRNKQALGTHLLTSSTSRILEDFQICTKLKDCRWI